MVFHFTKGWSTTIKLDHQAVVWMGPVNIKVSVGPYRALVLNLNSCTKNGIKIPHLPKGKMILVIFTAVCHMAKELCIFDALSCSLVSHPTLKKMLATQAGHSCQQWYHSTGCTILCRFPAFVWPWRRPGTSGAEEAVVCGDHSYTKLLVCVDWVPMQTCWPP